MLFQEDIVFVTYNKQYLNKDTFFYIKGLGKTISLGLYENGNAFIIEKNARKEFDFKDFSFISIIENYGETYLLNRIKNLNPIEIQTNNTFFKIESSSPDSLIKIMNSIEFQHIPFETFGFISEYTDLYKNQIFYQAYKKINKEEII